MRTFGADTLLQQKIFYVSKRYGKSSSTYVPSYVHWQVPSIN